MKKSFWEQLDALRGDRSVNGFAQFLGIPQKTMDGCFRYKRNPSIQTIKIICEKFSVSADWLLGIEEEQAESETPVSQDWKTRAQTAERKLKLVRSALNKATEGTRILSEGMKDLEAAI